MSTRSCLLVLGLLWLAAGVASTGDQQVERLRARLEVLDQPGELVAAGETLYAVRPLRDFYEGRGWQPAWFDAGGRERPALAGVIPALEAAAAQGLRPADYHLEALRDELAYVGDTPPGERDAGRLVDIELLASDAVLTLADHYANGRVNPATIDPGWFLERNNPSLPETLDQAVQEYGAPARVLAALLPGDPDYDVLVNELADQRSRSLAGGWNEIPPGLTLHPGDRNPRVAVVRERLDTPSPADDDTLYDGNLETAVRLFQERNGLDVDGVVGERTLAALNVSPTRRADQLRANLERWRWLPRRLGDEYILVNVGGFRLKVVGGGQGVMERRVIVGRPYRRTPVFTAAMTYLVLNPSWEVPRKLAVQDILPHVLEDPAYLAHLGFRVLQGWGADEKVVDPGKVDWEALSRSNFPYRLRQEPGPENALGRVKFMFPNAHDVYLHDTPAQGLFSKEERAFSSGCIRVEDPVPLADWLLSGPGRPAVMTPAEIRRILETGRETTMRLGRPVPVYLVYWTVRVMDDGDVQYRRDIYGRDDPLIEALDAPPPGAR